MSPAPEEAGDRLADNGVEPPITEAQRQDLEWRIAAYEADPKVGRSWDKVKGRLQQAS